MPAANTWRGALGLHLPKAMFAPQAKGGPSGLSDSPRPFVIRASHLDDGMFNEGSHFHVDIVLFALPMLADAVSALQRVAEEGIGLRRGAVELLGVSSNPLAFDLSPPSEPVHHITIRFLTPTQLKPISEPHFEILAARMRDRISTLSTLYGEGPPQMDFTAFAQRAANVRMTHSNLQYVTASRRSTRTGQTHPLSGFTGEAIYEGEITEFIPFLRIAEWTGIGRQTSFGNGQIAIKY